MALNFISAQEAAEQIKNGDNVGFSGFTASGTPKVVTEALAELESDSEITMINGVDVSGEEKKNLTVEQLLGLFSKASGSDEADDKLFPIVFHFIFPLNSFASLGIFSSSYYRPSIFDFKLLISSCAPWLSGISTELSPIRVANHLSI